MVPSVGAAARLVPWKPHCRPHAEVRSQSEHRLHEARQPRSAGERSDHRALLRRDAELRLQGLSGWRRTVRSRQGSQSVGWYAAPRRIAVGAWGYHAADPKLGRAALYWRRERELATVSVDAQRRYRRRRFIRRRLLLVVPSERVSAAIHHGPPRQRYGQPIPVPQLLGEDLEHVDVQFPLVDQLPDECRERLHEHRNRLGENERRDSACWRL